MDIYSVNWLSVSLRMILAVLLGGLIGYEREKTGHPAGMRTHMLICLGSALVMITNQYIYQNLSSVSDPARMAAQVVSGIGFLGAGTIMVVGNKSIKGLTTAAGIWASASVGIAIGIGFYFGAAGAAVLIFLILKIPRSFEQGLACRQQYVRLYVEIENMDTVDILLRYFDASKISVPEFQVNKDASKGSGMELTLRLGIPKDRDISKTLSEMAKINGVSSIEEMEK